VVFMRLLRLCLAVAMSQAERRADRLRRRMVFAFTRVRSRLAEAAKPFEAVAFQLRPCPG